MKKRKNGLCIWCGVKFVKGHYYLKSQLYQLLVENGNEGEEDTELFMDCEDHPDESGHNKKEEPIPVISLHALIGITGYHTMRV